MLIGISTIFMAFLFARKFMPLIYALTFGWVVGIFSWCGYEFIIGLANVFFIPEATLPDWGQTWILPMSCMFLIILLYKYWFGISFKINLNALLFGTLSIILILSWWIFPSIRLGNTSNITVDFTWLQGFLLRIFSSLAFTFLTFGRSIQRKKNKLFEYATMGLITMFTSFIIGSRLLGMVI